MLLNVNVFKVHRLKILRCPFVFQKSLLLAISRRYMIIASAKLKSGFLSISKTYKTLTEYDVVYKILIIITNYTYQLAKR